MTEPVEEFIPRKVDPETEDILGQLSKLIEELVNFGSQILLADDAVGRTDQDLPSMLFLRNFLEQMDAISVLVRVSAGDPCKILLRTALENLFSLEYLFEKDTKQRALSFIFWDAIASLKLLRQGDSDSEAYKSILRSYEKDKLLRTSKPLIVEDVRVKIEAAETLIGSTSFAVIKSEYDSLITVRKNPAWYTFFGGPANLSALALHLGYPALYEILYRGWSHSTHGNNIVHGKLAGKEGGVFITQIRSPFTVQEITQHCVNLSVIAFKAYIKHRVPKMQHAFDHWYRKHISKHVIALSTCTIFTMAEDE